jgi:hypothetical protein
MDGVDAGPWMGSCLGSSFFYFFIFINRGRQLVRLGKSMIYHDLYVEADGFLPVLVKFIVVVLAYRSSFPLSFLYPYDLQLQQGSLNRDPF